MAQAGVTKCVRVHEKSFENDLTNDKTVLY